jgi:hypothetical protein
MERGIPRLLNKTYENQSLKLPVEYKVVS